MYFVFLIQDPHGTNWSLCVWISMSCFCCILPSHVDLGKKQRTASKPFLFKICLYNHLRTMFWNLLTRLLRSCKDTLSFQCVNHKTLKRHSLYSGSDNDSSFPSHRCWMSNLTQLIQSRLETLHLFHFSVKVMNYQVILSLLPALFKGTKSHLDGAQSFHFCPNEASSNFVCFRGAQGWGSCLNTDGSYVGLSPCTGFRRRHHFL